MRAALRLPGAPAARRPADSGNASSGFSSSPRVTAQRTRLQAIFGSEAAVQRKVAITGIHADAREDEIEAFLRRYGFHWYYSYAQASQSVDGTFADSPEGARSLAKALSDAMSHLDDSASEVQQAVQRRLVEIAELVRAVMARDTQDKVGVGRRERDAWYGDFILNGLCLGFVKVFEQHPRWTRAMWQTLSTWQPPAGSVDGILEHLNGHIESVMRFGDGRQGENMREAVLLAREAWDAMNESGEPPKYPESPVSVVASARGTPSAHDSVSMRADRVWEVDGNEPTDRWRAVLDETKDVIGSAHGHFHVIVYHEGHEMAVHYHRPANEAPENWTVVETNRAGIVDCRSWDEVGAHIAPQLANAENEFGVEVRSQPPRH
ncbi:MAG: hypothetical protein GC151_16095 [Betaproteobacteria bacterium]|nr:hypothetical protein [Betaproteobacteria bacterium]